MHSFYGVDIIYLYGIKFLRKICLVLCSSEEKNEDAATQEDGGKLTEVSVSSGLKRSC